jgi:hypothetical protein
MAAFYHNPVPGTDRGHVRGLGQAALLNSPWHIVMSRSGPPLGAEKEFMDFGHQEERGHHLPEILLLLNPGLVEKQ